MQLVESVPGEDASISVFESSAGEQYSVERPQMSPEEESAVIDVLLEILKDKGLQ
jgi:hypothetical protein